MIEKVKDANAIAEIHAEMERMALYHQVVRNVKFMAEKHGLSYQEQYMILAHRLLIALQDCEEKLLKYAVNAAPPTIEVQCNGDMCQHLAKS